MCSSNDDADSRGPRRHVLGSPATLPDRAGYNGNLHGNHNLLRLRDRNTGNLRRSIEMFWHARRQSVIGMASEKGRGSWNARAFLGQTALSPSGTKFDWHANCTVTVEIASQPCCLFPSAFAIAFLWTMRAVGRVGDGQFFGQ